MTRRALLAVAALALPLAATTSAAAAGNRLCIIDDPRLHRGDLQAALRGTPVRIRLPNQSQREGVGVVGGALWLASEGRDQPIISVPLPSAAGLAPTTAPSRSSNPSSSAPAPGHGSSGSGIGWGLIVIVAAAVLAFVLGSRLRRRGRHRDEGGDDLSWTG